MDLKVSWSKSAIEQLETIFDYYKNKANERIAKEIVKRIVDKTLLLETQPRIGPQEELLRSRKFEYRYLLEGNYKIIYWVDELFWFQCSEGPLKSKIVIQDFVRATLHNLSIGNNPSCSVE